MFMFTKLYMIQVLCSLSASHQAADRSKSKPMLDVSGVIFKIVIDLTRVYPPLWARQLKVHQSIVCYICNKPKEPFCCHRVSYLDIRHFFHAESQQSHFFGLYSALFLSSDQALLSGGLLCTLLLLKHRSPAELILDTLVLTKSIKSPLCSVHHTKP